MNLFIIDMGGRYIHLLLFICEPLTLEAVHSRAPRGVKVPHMSKYVLCFISSLVIGPRGLGC